MHLEVSSNRLSRLLGLQGTGLRGRSAGYRGLGALGPPHQAHPPGQKLQLFFFWSTLRFLTTLNLWHISTSPPITAKRMASHSLIEPNSWVLVRSPNGATRLLQIVPNT